MYRCPPPAPLPTFMLDNWKQTGNYFDDSWKCRPLQPINPLPVKPLKSDFNSVLDIARRNRLNDRPFLG